MAPTEPPKFSKKRRLGKGKKKAWRTAKTQDLEDFLDDERRQRETGGLVSEKSDDTLFFVDTGKATVKESESGKPVSKESRRNRALRSTALLEPNPNIESVIKPLSKNYKKGKRTLKILDRINSRAASQVRVAGVQQRQKYVKDKVAEKKLKRQLPKVSYDIWNDDLRETAKVKRPRRLLSKPSKLPATAVPHPGISVNPTYEDHQDLLEKALVVEDSNRKAARRPVAVPIKKEDLATAATYLEEMSAGLLGDSESENDDEEEDGTDEVQPSVRIPHRKTKKQKKYEARLGEQMRKKKEETDKNRRENMVYRMRGIKSEINKETAKIQEKLEKNMKLKEEKPFTTRRLGKLKYQDPPVALKLSEELVATMREVKPEGNLLDDVYKGMLKRNIMEPRFKQKKQQKSIVKTYIKKSHAEVAL